MAGNKDKHHQRGAIRPPVAAAVSPGKPPLPAAARHRNTHQQPGLLLWRPWDRDREHASSRRCCTSGCTDIYIACSQWVAIPVAALPGRRELPFKSARPSGRRARSPVGPLADCGRHLSSLLHPEHAAVFLPLISTDEHCKDTQDSYTLSRTAMLK